MPPSSGSFKIDVDGALYPTKKMAGIGLVIKEFARKINGNIKQKN